MALGSPCSRPLERSSHGCRRGSLGAPWLLLLSVCLLPGALGCKGSVKGEAKASSSGESEVDFDASSKRDEAWESEALPSSASSGSSSARSSATSTSDQPAAPAAMLGARHDLTARGTSTPTCQCLVVLAGEPSRAGLAWSGSPPVIDAKTQLVVALTSEGVSCSAPAPRASYMGYEVRGADVVIQVEGAVAGRPLTQGAIVPRPTSGGKLIIESAAGLPYGKPVSGSGSCTVGY